MSSFFSALMKTILNFFKLFTDVYDGIINFISDIIDAVKDFGTNVIDSLTDFIIDLPVNIINLLFDLLDSIMGLFPQVCDYCFSDLVPDLKFNWSLMLYSGDIGQSLCYVLSQIKYGTALQTLSCGCVMWLVLRVISLIRG